MLHYVFAKMPDFRYRNHNLIKLKEEATKVRYRLEVENRFEILAETTEERTPNELWEEMKMTEGHS